MLSRREFVIASGTAALSMACPGYAADMMADENPGGGGEPVVLGPDYDGPLPSDFRIRGKFPPKDKEEEMARQILRNAPRSSPLAIMRYFEGLRQKNADGEAYNAGWAHRWNPVIVEFYTATSDTHSGDRTAWCAAFLNWCLARAGYKGGTKTTNSGSFRDAPGRTTSPRQGDIVVYKSSGCQGHVALYLRRTSSSILVIGGNQTNTAGHSSINIKEVPFPGSGLRLHSFHEIAAFRQAVSPLPRCT